MVAPAERRERSIMAGDQGKPIRRIAWGASEADVTAATPRAADPAHADELALAEADHKRQCDDGAINADIRLHLRPGTGTR